MVKPHRLACILLVLVSLLGVAPALADGKSRLTQRIKVQLAAEEESGGITVTTPTRLYNEYQSNELAADESYKGQWLQLKGRVLGVAKTPSGKPYITMMADQYGIARVHVQLFSYQVGERFPEKKDFTAISAMDVAIGLRKGQEITINGKGAGLLMGIPRIDSALVVTW